MTTAAVFAPASIGNFAAGFDVLGMAVRALDGPELGDRVEASRADRDELRLEGPFAAYLEGPLEDNLVTRARQAFDRRLGGTLPPLRLTLHKGLPIASGLGSSAASAVATAAAINHLLGEPLDPDALLAITAEAEAALAGSPHLDNVAPSLLGGLRLITVDHRARPLPFPAALRIVLFQPELRLPTRESRAVLPGDVGLGTAVHHAANLASLVDALYRGDLELLARALTDPLAEPYRAPLVPGLRQVQRSALEAGALGCTLSGSGPAIFAVVPAERAEGVAETGLRAWQDEGVRARARLCTLDPEGARKVG